MDRPDSTSERPLLAAVLVAFLATAVLAVVDLIGDLGEGTSRRHLAVEAGIAAVGLIGAGFVARTLLAALARARRADAEVEALTHALAAREAEAERWRAEARELVAGLGRAIDDQFDRWQLSPAEKEVGLLLLKGLSHKEIAAAREVTEATARQQARALYRKAGLGGRHDLAAFFLEDLMLPPGEHG